MKMNTDLIKKRSKIKQISIKRMTRVLKIGLPYRRQTKKNHKT
jgi:hypothetical protein